ncbi:MAG: hypothetical protein IKR48_01580 [Kiritimatiellae bacterium]|nr:hypothetical protein [Kiritimatiellia bacterium]
MKLHETGLLVLGVSVLLSICVDASAAELTARSYVQSGLIAQWDGIENAGWGTHDANAAKPIELISGIETELTGTIPAGDNYFTFGTGYLHFNSETIRDLINSGNMTVEITAKNTGRFLRNGGLIAFGSTTRGLWAYQAAYDNGGGILMCDYSYHANVSGQNNAFHIPGVNATTITFLLSSSGGSTFGLDGGSPIGQLTRYSTDMTDTDCYLGTLAASWLNIKAHAYVYSIRIYNRKLTAAEVAENGRIDRDRFGITPNMGETALFQPIDANDTTAQSYVQDGLIAQWDGIENAGYGLHDANATKPIELVSGIATELLGGTIPADEKSFTLGNGYLKFNSPEILSAINEGRLTIEIALSKNGAYVHNGGVIAFGLNATRGFWLYQQNDSFCNGCSYHANSGQYSNIFYNLDGTNTLSFALSAGGTNHWYISGAPAPTTISRYATDVAEGSDGYIGLLPGYNVKPNARVFAIRIYGRTLTEKEIAKNAAIDRRRFGTGKADATSYVRSGLLAQWDGAANHGFGLYNNSSDRPVELASGYVQTLTGRMPPEGSAFILGSGFLQFQSQEIIDALNAGHATVELVAAENGSRVNNGGFVAFGNQTRAFWAYQQDVYFLRSVSYHATTSGSAANGVYKDINFNEPGTNSFSFLLSNEATAICNTNGFLFNTFPRSNTDTENTDCFIGNLANYNRKPNAKIFSIRVYDRVLTATELENNQIVDRLRFNLHDWTGEGGTTTWTDASNWKHSGGAAAVPGYGTNVRVAEASVNTEISSDLSVLALEDGGTLNLPRNVTVGTHVLLTNGVAVARGGYTGNGNRGTRVSWLEGPGLLRVGGGLAEEIPSVHEFPSVGLILSIQ